MNSLENKYKFNFKEKGQILFHLGCDFVRDSNGVLCFVPHKHTYNMVHTYMNMFFTKPKLQKYVRYPLEKGDHTEIETSDILDNEETQKS